MEIKFQTRIYRYNSISTEKRTSKNALTIFVTYVSMLDRSYCRTLCSFSLGMRRKASSDAMQHLAGPRDRFARKDRILLITGTTLRSPRAALGIVRVTISRLENGGTLPTEREILSRKNRIVVFRLGCVDYFRKIFEEGQLLNVNI